MKSEEKQLLEGIEKIQKNQGVLLLKIRSAQQELFQLYGQRHLLQQKMMHRQLEEVLEYLPGSFAQNALYTRYLGLCIEMKIELNPEDHPLLKRLIDWSDSFPSLEKEPEVSVIETVTPIPTLLALSCYEEYITYLNFIGADLIKVIRRSKGSEDRLSTINLQHLKVEDLLQFLINSLPKTLFNIILPRDVLPPQYRENPSLEILFRSTDFEFFIRSKPIYATLIRILIKILLKLELKPSQQKTMMEVVFRYFYSFHHDKKYASTDIFIETYNVIHESVRFAMADEFVLFFKVIRKIGKDKFCDFLLSKSQWLKDIDHKVAEGNYVGYNKETLSPFPALRIPDNFTVPNGKVEYRTFEVLQDYSLFYFLIEVASHDIDIRLNYLGDFTAEKPLNVQLLNYEKKSGILKANIMAAKKGIYQFEFDNSYSWVNSKSVHFEKIVLMPLEFSSPDTPQWLPSYYENVPLTHIADQSKVLPILKREPPKKLPPKQEASQDSVGNITKKGSFFNMKIRRGTNLYEFESEHEDQIFRKFSEIVDLGGKIKWMVGGEPLEDSQLLPKMLKHSQQQPDSQDPDSQDKAKPEKSLEKQRPPRPPKEEPKQLPLKKEEPASKPVPEPLDESAVGLEEQNKNKTETI